jgi:hypothetical protein
VEDMSLAAVVVVGESEMVKHLGYLSAMVPTSEPTST